MSFSICINRCVHHLCIWGLNCVYMFQGYDFVNHKHCVHEHMLVILYICTAATDINKCNYICAACKCLLYINMFNLCLCAHPSQLIKCSESQYERANWEAVSGSIIIQICWRFRSVCVHFSVCACMQINCLREYVRVVVFTLVVHDARVSWWNLQLQVVTTHKRQLPACRLRAKHIASEMTDARHTQLWGELHCGLDVWEHGSLQINWREGIL